jgi:6-pyruvoyltetrahydropterin/6-carboxytetrahydropterin synthase
MFELLVETEFSAAHALRNYSGKCTRVHGHNFRVQMLVRGEQLDPSTGLLVDFGDLKRHLRETCDDLDHHFLNELPPFQDQNPSAENIARYIFQQMVVRLKSVDNNLGKVAQVRVWERDIQYAAYWE